MLLNRFKIRMKIFNLRVRNRRVLRCKSQGSSCESLLGYCILRTSTTKPEHDDPGCTFPKIIFQSIIIGTNSGLKTGVKLLKKQVI